MIPLISAVFFTAATPQLRADSENSIPADIIIQSKKKALLPVKADNRERKKELLLTFFEVLQHLLPFLQILFRNLSCLSARIGN